MSSSLVERFRPHLEKTGILNRHKAEIVSTICEIASNPDPQPPLRPQLMNGECGVLSANLIVDYLRYYGFQTTLHTFMAELGHELPEESAATQSQNVSAQSRNTIVIPHSSDHWEQDQTRQLIEDGDVQFRVQASSGPVLQRFLVQVQDYKVSETVDQQYNSRGSSPARGHRASLNTAHIVRHEQRSPQSRPASPSTTPRKKNVEAKVDVSHTPNYFEKIAHIEDTHSDEHSDRIGNSNLELSSTPEIHTDSLLTDTIKRLEEQTARSKDEEEEQHPEETIVPELQEQFQLLESSSEDQLEVSKKLEYSDSEGADAYEDDTFMDDTYADQSMLYIEHIQAPLILSPTQQTNESYLDETATYLADNTYTDISMDTDVQVDVSKPNNK